MTSAAFRCFGSHRAATHTSLYWSGFDTRTPFSDPMRERRLRHDARIPRFSGVVSERRPTDCSGGRGTTAIRGPLWGARSFRTIPGSIPPTRADDRLRSLTEVFPMRSTGVVHRGANHNLQRTGCRASDPRPCTLLHAAPPCGRAGVAFTTNSR